MAKSSLYVIQVTGGQEERARGLVLRLLPDVAEDCYTPAFEAMKKIRGEWKLSWSVLFPGYIFVQTSDPAALARRLVSVPAFTRLLGGNDDVFIPLTDEEEAWLNAFTNVETHLVEMSEGVIEGDRVLVTRGPLHGHEAQIARVDRHRRTAELEVHMFGRTKRIKVGLEIVRKQN